MPFFAGLAFEKLKPNTSIPYTLALAQLRGAPGQAMKGESTRCAACHTGEVQTFTSALPIDVFESDIIEPFSMMEVDVPSLRAERMGCDAAAEPARCELLGALFDYGDVTAAPNGIMF